VRWVLSLRLPARQPLWPRARVVIRELVDNELAAVGRRAARKPVGMRTRLAVAWVSSMSTFKMLSFLRFDMRGGGKNKTRVHRDNKKMKKSHTQAINSIMEINDIRVA
jgi:hypothetical protein